MKNDHLPMTSPDLPSAPATAATKIARPKNLGREEPVQAGSLPRRTHVTNLDIDVTEDCNLGCLYCFKGEMYSKHMSLDTMKRALDWLLAASGSSPEVNCNFMGGEPTMRFKVIREFVPWARRRGRQKGKLVTFSMTTNLTLFTDEIRDFVDQYGFGVLMSIDGAPEVQDVQRPAKNGKRVSETVAHWARSMLRSRPRSTARATLLAANVGALAASVRYLRGLGFLDVAISAAEYSEWSDTHFAELERQLQLIEVDTLTGWLNGERFLMSAHRYHINSLVRPRVEGREHEIESSRQPCGAGKGYMMIDYTGDIWPCHRFDGADTAAGAGGAFRLGNIYDGQFNDELQRAFIDFDHFKNHKASCETCPINPVCGGYCPAANLSDTGSIYTPHDTYCRWSQTWYRSSERLYERIRLDHSHLLPELHERIAGAAGTGEK